MTKTVNTTKITVNVRIVPNWHRSLVLRSLLKCPITVFIFSAVSSISVSKLFNITRWSSSSWWMLPAICPTRSTAPPISSRSSSCCRRVTLVRARLSSTKSVFLASRPVRAPRPVSPPSAAASRWRSSLSIFFRTLSLLMSSVMRFKICCVSLTKPFRSNNSLSSMCENCSLLFSTACIVMFKLDRSRSALETSFSKAFRISRNSLFVAVFVFSSKS
mmetsp:Transcript_44025/g.72959  ORF Transcript_44025/g.72959 Transcript_44025/m.72959 type:complete len:217 (+) Transcript_44025:280-930(+)